VVGIREAQANVFGEELDAASGIVACIPVPLTAA